MVVTVKPRKKDWNFYNASNGMENEMELKYIHVENNITMEIGTLANFSIWSSRFIKGSDLALNRGMGGNPSASVMSINDSIFESSLRIQGHVAKIAHCVFKDNIDIIESECVEKSSSDPSKFMIKWPQYFNRPLISFVECEFSSADNRQHTIKMDSEFIFLKDPMISFEKCIFSYESNGKPHRTFEWEHDRLEPNEIRRKAVQPPEASLDPPPGKFPIFFFNDCRFDSKIDQGDRLKLFKNIEPVFNDKN